MENASKFLIMAATVLIALMLIGIFVYVFIDNGQYFRAFHEKFPIKKEKPHVQGLFIYNYFFLKPCFAFNFGLLGSIRITCLPRRICFTLPRFFQAFNELKNFMSNPLLCGHYKRFL